MLARREHSELELVRKLRAKGFPEEAILKVMTELAQKNYQSNDRFLENYISHRRKKGFGPIRIQAELMERGLPADLIEQALNASDSSWQFDLETLWQKKFKGKQPQDFKEKIQQMRFLQYRGFTLEQITNLNSLMGSLIS